MKRAKEALMHPKAICVMRSCIILSSTISLSNHFRLLLSCKLGSFSNCNPNVESLSLKDADPCNRILCTTLAMIVDVALLKLAREKKDHW
jgi:hypothetical protein